ncbi:MAG: tetratricopeptide repeat protein, partial [Desulfobulbaceae bacterium]|nr:tetratricopeptide repeat protein [Desulfobulbaceae bacterium]
YGLAMTTLTLPVFGNRYARSREIALAATLLWALHPLQTNAVTYIVQRMTSMSALFVLSSLWFYVRGRLWKKPGQRLYFYAASLLCGGLAVISKENAVMLPVMIVGYEFFLLSDSVWKRNWRQIVIAAGLAVSVVLVFAWVYLGDSFIITLPARFSGREFTLGERLLTESRVLFLYLGLLALPLPSQLNLCHDIVLSRGLFSPPQTALALFALVGLLVLAVFLFRRDRLASFAIFWFLGNLLIESTVIPLELIFEHRLYLPSTFLLLSVVAAGYRFWPGKLFFQRLLVVVLVVGCVFLTWQRNKAWASTTVLWKDVIAKSPALVRGYQNLALSYENAEQDKKAEQFYLQGLMVSQRRVKTLRRNTFAARSRADIYAGLASIYWKNGRWQEAFANSERALKIVPNNIDAMITKGICYEKYGQSENAIAMYVAANIQGEESVDLFSNWGVSCFSLGRIDEAITLFRRALAIDDEHAESHYNLGIAYGSKGMNKEARREMALAMKLQQK